MGREPTHTPLTPGNLRWMDECRAWVQDVVEGADDFDAVPALLLTETPEPVYASPVTMISKRIEAGQFLDYVALVELAENVARSIA